MMKGGSVDILSTYADIIEVCEGDKFRCLICVRRAAISESGEVAKLNM